MSPHGPAPLARLAGMGGLLLLYPEHLRIERIGLFFAGINILHHLEREMETTIPLRALTGVHFVRSLLLVQFLRFTYAGCPAPTGHYLRDAFAENAFMLSLADNRPLLAMMARIEAQVAALATPGHEVSSR